MNCELSMVNCERLAINHSPLAIHNSQFSQGEVLEKMWFLVDKKGRCQSDSGLCISP
jgi:hypothetical protein